MSYDVILPWRTVHLCSHSVLKRTSPLAVVSLGAYLSHGWYDALWMQCVHVIRAAVSTPDDKVTRSVKAAYKQACPLLDRKLGAAEALPCLICQQCSLPPRLITASMSDGVHNSMLDGCFDFSLCDTSVACHAVLCLSCERDRGKSASHLSVRVYKQGWRLQTGQHGMCCAEGQNALWDTRCTCAAATTSHQSS